MLNRMNWREIDECWKSFAASHDAKLHTSNRNILYGEFTQYSVKLTREKYNLTFLGDLKKSTSGHNRSSTTLIIRDLEHQLTCGNVSNSNIFLIFKKRYRNAEKSRILNLLRRHGALELVQDEDLVKITFPSIFTSIKDFENAQKLVLCAAQQTSDTR